jgi:UPF0716 protein FxsA
MFFYLLLAFTFIPAVEIALFVRIGSVIGPLATFAVVIATGIAGAALARSQGLRVVSEIQSSLSAGRLPADELAGGALVLIGGTLLLTPGFLTDLVGLACLAPVSRHILVAMVKRWFRQRLEELQEGGASPGGWDIRVGGVRPGPAARQAGFGGPQLQPQQPPRGDAEAGPRTIDAAYSVVGEDSADSVSESSVEEPGDSEPGEG